MHALTLSDDIQFKVVCLVGVGTPLAMMPDRSVKMYVFNNQLGRRSD